MSCQLVAAPVPLERSILTNVCLPQLRGRANAFVSIVDDLGKGLGELSSFNRHDSVGALQSCLPRKQCVATTAAITEALKISLGSQHAFAADIAAMKWL